MLKNLKAFCIYELKKIINTNDLMLSLNYDVFLKNKKNEELLKITGSYQSILEKVESDEYDTIGLVNLLNILMQGNTINEAFVIDQYKILSAKLDSLI